MLGDRIRDLVGDVDVALVSELWFDALEMLSGLFKRDVWLCRYMRMSLTEIERLDVATLRVYSKELNELVKRENGSGTEGP